MTQAASDATTDNEVQIEQEQHEGQEVQQTGEAGEQGAQAEGGTGAEDEEVVVTIGGESPPPEEDESRAPEWVRELRKSNREKDRKLREQEAEIARLRGTGQQPAAIVVGEKPSLEGCNYDATKFEAELDAWKERKAQADAQEQKKTEESKKQQEAWQATLQNYEKRKAALKVSDYQDAEDTVRSTMSVVQQGILLDATDAPELVVVALGKNPQKLKELAAIGNPIKFTAAIAKLETQLKVTPRKAAPPPERTVRSSVPGSAAVDNQLEKLRAEAAKTGDLSKVVAFKNQLRGRG